MCSINSKMFWAEIFPLASMPKECHRYHGSNIHFINWSVQKVHCGFERPETHLKYKTNLVSITFLKRGTLGFIVPAHYAPAYPGTFSKKTLSLSRLRTFALAAPSTLDTLPQIFPELAAFSSSVSFKCHFLRKVFLSHLHHFFPCIALTSALSVCPSLLEYPLKGAETFFCLHRSPEPSAQHTGGANT